MNEFSNILFRLMSWLSPAFPVGAFSYSHGLEWAAQSGLVRDADSLEHWIATGLAHEFGPLNGAILRMSWEAATTRDVPGFRHALMEARALMATAEFELEATAQGAAFFSTLRKTAGALPLLDWAEKQLAGMAGPVPYPFAVGIAAASVDAPLDLALVAFFQALSGNLVSAGLRLLPLGQTPGQRIVARLQEPVIALARDVMARRPGDIGTAAPIMEWSSICHETQYTRLFRS